MKNPYRVATSQQVRITVHKDLAIAINRERLKQQRVSDMKFGKNKFKVPASFASKVLGGLLK